MLNRFDSQISSVLSGMIVMAIPLMAIYTFEQNKQKLLLRLKGGQSAAASDEPDAAAPAAQGDERAAARLHPLTRAPGAMIGAAAFSVSIAKPAAAL